MAGIKPLRTPDPFASPEALVQAVDELQTHAEQLDRVQLLNGQLVTGIIPNGSATVAVRHSLGRQYVGGFIVGVSDAAAVHVQTPKAASATVDVSKYVVIGAPAALAQDTTINAWVF